MFSAVMVEEVFDGLGTMAAMTDREILEAQAQRAVAALAQLRKADEILEPLVRRLAAAVDRRDAAGYEKALQALVDAGQRVSGGGPLLNALGALGALSGHTNQISGNLGGWEAVVASIAGVAATVLPAIVGGGKPTPQQQQQQQPPPNITVNVPPPPTPAKSDVPWVPIAIGVGGFGALLLLVLAFKK